MLMGAAALLLLALIFGPQLWTRHVLEKYSAAIEDMPGTGGELAAHLIDRLGLTGAAVEATEAGNDHYDPEERRVRLSPRHHDGKSLTAVVVAAHEVGHALQHKLEYPPLFLRWRLTKLIKAAEKLASLLLIAFPFVTALTRMPAVGGMMFLAGAATLLLPVILHLITLPVEWDASFRRALPILVEGRYIPASAVPAARRILTAAALTYVAASLASILNFYRWVVFLRR
ncbi:MAG: zinc metallopeptidase [Gammaproteobacteria bacterium]|nr:zinc metallopeptidase [Gammaproteobacteria bacterium]